MATNRIITDDELGRTAASTVARASRRDGLLLGLPVFGDETAFPSASADPPGSSRRFTSFGQAADENADSRVMGGIHFRFACDAGQELGRKVAEWTLANSLQDQGALRSDSGTH